jgi:DNA-binding CsgD family transcriptional regulator
MVEPLTEREEQVLHLLAEGYTNQEIADQLIISVKTAETHRGRIMQKLGLHRRVELLRYARTHSLVRGSKSLPPWNEGAPGTLPRLVVAGRDRRGG